MSTTNIPSKPTRRRPGRPRKQQHPQASVTPPSAPDQACPSTATQLSDAPPQRTTEPVNTPYPQIYPNYPFSFYTDVSGSGDPFIDSNTGPGFDYTGDLENTNLDLTQGFPALGLSTALRSLSSALETTPIDPQLSSVDTQVSTSTETAASQPQTNPTTDAALSSTSQATTQEHRQPTIEEEVLALSAAIVGESSQSATPAQPTTVPEGPSEQAPPATSKRAQKAPPKQPRKRKADQVDGQSTSGPATKKQATESAKEKSNEAPKEPPKNPRKRKADQVDGQSAPATAAKKTATEKSKETSEEQSQDTSKEQSQADSSDNPEPQFRASFKEDRSNRLSRWAHSFAETVAKNQFDALDYLEIFQPDTVAQQAASQEAASQQSAKGQPAVDQPAGDKPTGKKPAGKKSVVKKSARNQSAESPAENQPAENQPAGEPTTNMQANEQTQGVPNPNEQPVDPAIKSPGHYAEKEARRCIKVGGINFQRAGLGLPHGLGAEENNRRVSFLEAELKLQKGRAPILPPSQLAQPDPKPFTPKAYQVPDNVTDTRVLEFFRKKNIDLCTKNKQVDLERNNQAAKGTRSRREEALDAHRELANNMAVELNWWRLKAIANGADFREWDVVPPTVKQCMLNEMNERVKKLEEAAAKTAKKNKSAAHSARTKRNSRLSKEDEARKKLEVQEVIAAFAAKDWATIKKMSDPEYKAKRPRAPRNTAASRRNRASVADEDTETSTAANTTEADTTENVAETTNTGVTTTMATDDMLPDTAPSDDMATGNIPSNNMPVDNAEFGGTEFGSMDFDNPSYNMPTNMPEMPSTDMTSDNTLGFGNVSSFNTSVAPAQFNAVPDPMYGGVPVEHPTYINPQINAFGSVYTQQQQPSDLPQGTGDCHELRRQPSNVTMLDAQSDPFQSIDPNMGGTMNETSPYWETPNAPPSHGSLPPNIDPSLLGTIGNESTLPPNNMSHNIHGPLGDPSLLLPNDIGQSSEGLANSVLWYSEEEALVRAFLPSLSRNTNQNTSTTNDKKTTDQVDTNANTSSKYPDPDEDFNFSRYINFSP
ncbi:hypothetical protein FGSG_05325 [Fusarium graminearum PH-1]|uniref:Chromosome 3, complete genome n=1 Tax=Gibberella zeae (strain ATCC MYA-4620 / CBS 123657 / FGSC 9075 / NRRL 31084 / PH-1) TaxID=229533 RepID=I1RMX2_GIBZE|nr:hypothetical protein FGSG_05325 [Fusarium graminearum PH-1]ESU11264.1 hypothetical protein FGSG_05325 [Fusarium graminearum PH-1]CAF3509927.1 unnamed protein product [Fusarium graminearum]CEF86828.1 unnamed protein product [Fusarium graminearum]|eukprot:XP_011323840.1 hypothetical protein FGSG_05325 [Fusarium graminearum PH-1]